MESLQVTRQLDQDVLIRSTNLLINQGATLENYPVDVLNPGGGGEGRLSLLAHCSGQVRGHLWKCAFSSQTPAQPRV